MPGTTLSSINTFGDLLKHLRRRARLTQRELGIAAGYSEGHVARLESGDRMPDTVTVRTLLVPALGLDKEPVLAARLLELAEVARGKSAPEAETAAAPAQEDKPPAAPRRVGSLPSPLTKFIGRRGDLAEVRDLLSTTRLLTITGSAGAGKTRLAIEVGTGLAMGDAPSQPSFAGGVWMVELATVTDPNLVAERIALKLGAPGADALIDHLHGSGKVLLILDNCEHLIGACAALAERLLQACPELQVMATSREGLNVPGETIWRIPSLTTDEGVSVFADRARAAKPGFALNDQNALVIAQICQRLDGIPLAIELAASRLRALSPDPIAERLNDRFTLLSGGARTALPRHQTLRTLIDWSYDLLSEPERVLLRRLSIFSGGWTLEAAEAVAADEERSGMRDEALAALPLSREVTPCRLAVSEILPLLYELVGKSLVLMDEQAQETRYRLLETVREYGLDRLRECGELGHLRRKHAEVYLDLAEQAESHFRARGHKLWFDRLAREQDNIRAALAWSRDPGGDALLGLRLAGALWLYWMWGGHIGEGRRWCEDMLRDMPASVDPSVRAKLLLGAAAFEYTEGEPATQAVSEQAWLRPQEALAISRERGDVQGIVFSLCLLGIYAWHEHDLGRAQSMIEQSLATARGAGHPALMGWPLERLAALAIWKQEFTRAISVLEDYLALGRKNDDEWGVAEALVVLGGVALRQLDFRRTMEMSQQGLQMARRVGYRRIEIQALTQIGEAARYMGDFNRARAAIEELRAGSMAQESEFVAGFAFQLLAKIARDEGDCRSARDLFVQSLRARQKLGPWSIPYNLEGLASVASAQHQAVRAAHLFGAAEAIRGAIHWPLWSDNLPEYERHVQSLRAQLDATTFAAAWEEGRAMTLEQAVEYALTYTPEL